MAIPLLVKALGIGVKAWNAYSKTHKAKVLAIAKEQSKRTARGGKAAFPNPYAAKRHAKAINRSTKQQVATGGMALEGARQQAKDNKKKKKKKK